MSSGSIISLFQVVSKCMTLSFLPTKKNNGPSNSLFGSVWGSKDKHVLRLKFFLLSLSKTTFTWYSNLLSNLMCNWVEMKRQFYSQFRRTYMKY